jgi:hypothetical protein
MWPTNFKPQKIQKIYALYKKLKETAREVPVLNVHVLYSRWWRRVNLESTAIIYCYIHMNGRIKGGGGNIYIYFNVSAK